LRTNSLNPIGIDLRYWVFKTILDIKSLTQASRWSVQTHTDQPGEIHPFNSTEFYIDLVEEKIEKPTLLEDEDEDDESGSELEKTLNDSFVGSSYETVADTLKSSHKSGTLKSMLSINQKFMFINDLFNDSQDDFNKVMDFLESCETKDSAISFINNNYLKHNIWNANAPQVKEFLALLDKKFIA
jgi:hypothetical protein